MTKKTLIILIALFGIFLAYLSFEDTSYLFAGRSAITLFVRITFILVMTGGLLFLLGKRADDKIELRGILVGVVKTITNRHVVVLSLIVAILTWVVVLGLWLYEEQKPSKESPASKESPGRLQHLYGKEGSGFTEGLHRLDRFFK